MLSAKSNFYPSIIHALPVNRPDSRGAKMKAYPRRTVVGYRARE
jgi:hypothetical protein